MSVRVAAVLLILLPACASCLASPIGALTGPFAGPVLAQQRQAAARDSAAGQKTDPAAPGCQPEQAAKHDRLHSDAKPHCQAAAGDEVAVRNRPDPLPDPDRKPAGH